MEDNAYYVDPQARIHLDAISTYLGVSYTDEQMALAQDFTKSRISFSDPGSGKTQTALAGILLAQTMHKIPGSQIYAFSFTKAATFDFYARYESACKKCLITPNANFKTFHALCLSIVKEIYPNMAIKHGVEFQKDLPVLMDLIKDEGFDGNDYWFARNVLDAINSLNSALVFDEANVGRSYAFVKLGISVQLFQRLRKRWFLFNMLQKTITQGDIPIYTLYGLLTNSKKREEFAAKYKVVVADEFQDMSVLHLKILSLITKNLVAIGDIKQQIYGFNGASSYIVSEYFKMYPDAKQINLTKSFRCRNEIGEFSTNLIRQNFDWAKPFEGVGDGGRVEIMPSSTLDLKALVYQIKEEQEKVDGSEKKDVMFLFRNNCSSGPIAEELFKQDVLFRMPKFIKVMDIPIFKELCMMVEIAINPRLEEALANIPKVFPEFRKFTNYNCPLNMALMASKDDIFSINYKYKTESSIKIIQAMYKVREMVKARKPANVVLGSLLGVFETYVIEGKWWKYEHKKEFYFDLVSPVLAGKTYERMVSDEYEKERKVNDCMAANMGVKCYTVHAAKGLEADDVYILDADHGVFPSESSFVKYSKAGCEYEAAKDLRNERNLLYVAVTRAKDNVYIIYKEKLSPLVENPIRNVYSYLDEIYNSYENNFDDVAAFVSLVSGKGKSIDVT